MSKFLYDRKAKKYHHFFIKLERMLMYSELMNETNHSGHSDEALTATHDSEELTINAQLNQETEELKQYQAEFMEEQAQIAYASQLSSLEEMAAGLAHELNQPLFIIRLCADSLKLSLKKTENLHPEFDKDLNSIFKSVDRAANIIEHMLDFAGTRAVYPEKISILEPVDSSLSFFRNLFQHEKTSLQISYEDNLPKVFLDFQRFEQIMVNLLSNARYAVDQRQKQESEGYQKKIVLSIFQNKTENTVACEVADNGIGMTPEEKDRCLEPFFTTKDVGEGSGLGLSIVHGIIKKCNGKLEIESKEGAGTTIRMKFKVS